jgi:hypothetical protein
MDATRQTDSASNNLCYIDVFLTELELEVAEKKASASARLRGKSRQSFGSRSGCQPASVLP